MRLAFAISACVLLTRVAAAQEPFDYVSKQDYFSINMPAQPKVEETTYPDEYRLPAVARTRLHGGPGPKSLQGDRRRLP
jgi:hypothetical protein